MKKKTKSRDTAFKKTTKKALKHTKNVQKMTTVTENDAIQSSQKPATSKKKKLDAHKKKKSVASQSIVSCK
ncbi:MAG: hypothetical protein M1836_000216 [Candelina mexicana]|nr:MAG: hypothetical protein M1836_000216 [Candelina mexicana]